MKFRRQRYAGHVARLGRQEMHTEFRWEKLLENVHLENHEGDWFR